MSNKKLCWIDLETTGSKLETSQILEIGIAVTDDEGNIEAEGSWLNPVPLDSLRVATIDPVVLEMHSKSGLWADLQKKYVDPLNDPLNIQRVRTLRDLNGEIRNWLFLKNDQRTEHMALAGSGVSHFDRGFIRRDLPDVDRMLTYWAYDVGVVRRMLRLCGINTQSEDTMPNHRALDDVKAHIREYQAQLVLLRQIPVPSAAPTGTDFQPLFAAREGELLVEGGVA